jgi:uncharacterized hydrophobic protein (TIGR00271 family)
LRERGWGAAVWWRLRVIGRFLRRRLDATGLFPDLSGGKARALRQSVRDDGELTQSYMLMCGLSAGIAALGLLQSSSAVVIGAMLISPLMSPIASMGFGFASLDGRQIRHGARVMAVGAAIGILVSMALTWISPIRNPTPEIIARTEPTLLDLAVATLSGMAGAFATVWQRGATAIGVAIATALMPPLATVGYGLAVGNPAFLGGALLLFLTNLAAISFSFALIARLSGAARPLASVELDPRLLVAGLAAFLVLATPLALTLYRVTREGNTVALTRRVLQEELHVSRSNIAQLDVKWPTTGRPTIDAVLISPEYHTDAQERIEKRLTAALGQEPKLTIQQVVASDVLSKTRAIVDSTVERSVAGLAHDVPPLAAIRARIGIPVQALWVNRAERTVQAVPASGEGWTLEAYRALERKVANADEQWQVQIVPPAPAVLTIPIVADEENRKAVGLDAAIWAIGRWGLTKVALSGFSGRTASDAEQAVALANVRLVAAALEARGIGSSQAVVEAPVAELRSLETDSGPDDGVRITIVPPPPGAVPPALPGGGASRP